MRKKHIVGAEKLIIDDFETLLLNHYECIRNSVQWEFSWAELEELLAKLEQSAPAHKGMLTFLRGAAKAPACRERTPSHTRRGSDSGAAPHPPARGVSMQRPRHSE